VAKLIDLPYELSDGTEGYIQCAADIPEAQREAFRLYVIQRLEQNLRQKGQASG
jgi:hypothetical protein